MYEIKIESDVAAPSKGAWMRYPWDKMQPGDSADFGASAKRAHDAARKWGASHGAKFSRRGTRIWRIE